MPRQDFNKWLKTMGINPTERQPPQTRALLAALEGMFNLIIDLESRLEYLETHRK